MSGIIFSAGNLSETLLSILGFKTGLAMSLPELIDHIDNVYYKEILDESENKIIRLETTEFDDLYYNLLYRLGYTKKLQNGFPLLGLKYFHTHRVQYENILKLYNQISPALTSNALKAGTKIIDPTPFIIEARKKHGTFGAEIAIAMLESLDGHLNASPFTDIRFYDFENGIKLEELYLENKKNIEIGKFFDLRLLNYLSNNTDKMSAMNWRKFEEFVAELFHKSGYIVALGPGRNDDGVDIRVWKSSDKVVENPLFIVQCKRQKSYVEKAIVKSLYADVKYENAEYGLIVTTSNLSVGSKNTIESRGYPIKVVDQDKLKEWLQKLRTPGSGILKY